MPLSETLAGLRRIVCLGDSITEEGNEPGGYVDLIRQALPDIEVVGAGIGGHRSPDMRQRFARDVTSRRPDLVTISCGINDVWHGFDAFHPNGGGPRGVALPAYRRNIQAMVEAAQADPTLVVILSTTVMEEDACSPGNMRLRDYNAVLEQIAHLTDSRFIDLFQPFLDEIARHRKESGRRDLWLTTDGVHMNARGNELMARLVLRGLS